jgi:hypothetical protein
MRRATPEEIAELALARRILAFGAAAASGAEPPLSTLTVLFGSKLSTAITAAKSLNDAVVAVTHAATLPRDAAMAEADLVRQEIDRLMGGGSPPGAQELGALDAYDIGIRRIAVRTSTSPLSVPVQGAGHAVARSLGPYLDAAGQPFWIDLFPRVRETAVVRMPGTDPIIFVPLRGALAGATHYSLPAGSIWILSRLLASAAPAGGYCGIRIKGGTLAFSAPAVISGGTLQISASATATLEVSRS